ncbi:MAG: cell surface protein [Polyangiaceae bacterium]|nr:cell surface protein [Polyangiaceae bacterium]
MLSRFAIAALGSLVLSALACGDGSEPLDPPASLEGDVKKDPGPSPEASPFAVEVVRFSPGPGATFGQDRMPGVVLGPPEGGGDGQGGLDVVSLGVGGEIVLRLGVDAVDGPGADLVIFENPFLYGASGDQVWKEPGEVSVSEDGERWATFPCEPSDLEGTHCAGWRPVYSSTESGIDALSEEAGGDRLDLAVVGVKRARYVKIVDRTKAVAPPSAGFDLDAVAVLHRAP